MFVKSVVKIATCVHHAWLSMRRTCSVKCDWNVTLEWTLNVQENILSTFCFSLQFLYRDKTLHVCFLSSLFPKFWRGQIVPLTGFLRDNFNCSYEISHCYLLSYLSNTFATILNLLWQSTFQLSWWMRSSQYLTCVENGKTFYHLHFPVNPCLRIPDKAFWHAEEILGSTVASVPAFSDDE